MLWFVIHAGEYMTEVYCCLYFAKYIQKLILAYVVNLIFYHQLEVNILTLPDPMKHYKILFLILSCISILSKAEVKLPRIFSDNMVIQRDRPVKIWGWASK